MGGMEAFLDEKIADLETAILSLGPPDKVAAFIAEPILASGGGDRAAAGLPPTVP